MQDCAYFAMKEIFFLIFALNLFSIGLLAQSVSVNPPKNVHPRLLFTEEKLSEIKKNLLNPENLPAFNESENLLKEYFGKKTEFTLVKKRTFKWSGKILAAVEASAFKYAICKEKKYSEWAYKTFINCCKSIDLTGIYDDYRAYGQMMFTAAEIYDWCYDGLSAKQKETLYQNVVSFAKKLQIGYPPTKGKSVSGHSAECQLLRAYLSVGIAMYDEHKDLWEMSASRFYNEFVPARKFFYESGAPNFQGTGYGPYRSLFDLWASVLITSMKEEDPFESKTSLWSKYFIYNIRPDKMTWHIGDDHAIEKMNYNSARYGANAFLQSVISKDSYSKFFAKENTNDFTKFKYNENGESDDTISPVQFLILNDVNLIPQDYKNLNTFYYCPSPLGEYFAFSAWNKDSAAVHLKIGEYTQANHEHQDAGSFEIFCNGLLAATTGFYVSGGGTNGNGGYKSEHTQKFYHSSVSKNTILLQKDSNSYENYGLQKSVPEAKDLEQILTDKNYHRGKITAHYDNLKDKKGIIFLSGDISGAYNSDDFVHRSMLAYFTGDEKNPLLFFVYDQIESDLKGIFLLNTLKEAQIQKDTILLQNQQGKIGLKNKILLPENPSVKKIGGKGHEWELAGKNYSLGSEKSVSQKSESGWGRIEISDSEQKSNFQTLFNAMQIFSDDMMESKEQNIRLVQTEKIDFAVTDNLAVGFYKSLREKNDSKDYAISVPDFSTDIIVCNLPEGKWNLNGMECIVSEENRIGLFYKDTLHK